MPTAVEWLNNIMTRHWGISEEVANVIDGAAAIVSLALIALLINWSCQSIFTKVSSRNKRLKNSRWGKLLQQRKLARNLILIIPGLAFYIGTYFLFDKGSHSLDIIQRYCTIYFIIILILVANSFLLSFLDIYSNSEKSKKHPLKSLIQGMQVILYFIGGIIIISIIIDKSPTVLLTSLGASAAILMLIFKDSIQGFVAGVQLSRNNMIHIGDWIQMPDGSANGTVEEITLNTVKVRNWDNTLTMIPPYTLISTPFKNWNAMLESDGRQVDKSIYVDINSIQICDSETIQGILQTHPEMAALFHKQENPRHTNIQAYRHYIEYYLQNNTEVNQNLDIIITQKETTAYGIPIEVYFFLKDKSWANFEKKQSDIFAHIINSAQTFKIRLYQRP